MKLSPLSLSIFRHTWAIDPLYAFQIWPALEELRTGKVELSGITASESPSLEAVSAEAGAVTRYYSWEEAPKGSVAVIDLKGELMKDDQECGPRGTDTVGRRIQKANEMSNISAIVLRADTPGGTVDGLEVLGKIIKDSKKPVIAFVTGMMASAGLWLGSHAREIWASNDFDEVGSVGVLSSFMDLQPYYERLGAKFHKIVSSHSPDKTKMMDDIRKGIYDGYVQEKLDPLAKRFHEVVKENRPSVSEEHLTGKLYFAKDVMGVFVDRIGSFEDAVARAQDLAKAGNFPDNVAEEEDETEKNDVQINMKKMKQFKSINKALGVEQLESQNGTVALTEDQLSAIESTINDLAAKSVNRTTSVTGKDNGQNKDADWDTIDALEHNKEID